MSVVELTSVEAALAQSRTKQRVFWLAIFVLVASAAVASWLLFRWSSELKAQLDASQRKIVDLDASDTASRDQAERLRAQIGKTQQVMQQLESNQAATTQTAGVLEARLTAQNASQAQAANQLAALQERLRQTDGLLNALRAQNAEVTDAMTKARADLAGLQTQVGKAALDATEATGRAREAEAQSRRLLSELQQRDRQISNIEQELKSAHFVFKTKHWIPVAGMDISVRIRDVKVVDGVDVARRLQVTRTSDGSVLLEPRDVRMGETVTVGPDGDRYTITARYALRMVMAFDRVGFDINHDSRASQSTTTK